MCPHPVLLNFLYFLRKKFDRNTFSFIFFFNVNSSVADVLEKMHQHSYLTEIKEEEEMFRILTVFCNWFVLIFFTNKKMFSNAKIFSANSHFHYKQRTDFSIES